MLRNLLHTFFARIGVAFINLLILVLSARYLGVASRGEISIFLLNIMVIQIVCEIFTGYNIVHFVPRYNLTQIVFSGTLFIVFVAVAALIFFRITGGRLAENEPLGWCCVLLVLVHSFCNMIILARQKILLYNLLCLTQPLLLLAGIVYEIFIIHDFTFTAYLYPLLISFAIPACLSVAIVLSLTTKTKITAKFKIGPVLVNGLILQSATLMYLFINRYSFYLLPGSTSVGIYSAASSLMEAVLIIANSITPVILARVANQSPLADNSTLTLSLAKFSFLCSLLVVVIICFLPERILVVTLGDGFSGIKDIMLNYAPGILLVSIFTPVVHFFSAEGSQHKLIPAYAAAFALTLGCAPFFVDRFGVNGAAYMANAGYFVLAAGIFIIFFISQKLPLSLLLTTKTDISTLRRAFSVLK